MRKVTITGHEGVYHLVVSSTKNCRVQPLGGGDSFLVNTALITDLTMTEMAKAVLDHALNNYDQDGWDYMVETYELKDIAELVKDCKDVAAAIRKMGRVAKLLNERREEVMSTAF